jgi:hypothetical protein
MDLDFCDGVEEFVAFGSGSRSVDLDFCDNVEEFVVFGSGSESGIFIFPRSRTCLGLIGDSDEKTERDFFRGDPSATSTSPCSRLL